MSEVITLICPIHAAPGRGRELEAALVKLASAVIREAGNICYRPHATENPDEFVIYEQWRNAAALDAHMKEPHLIAFLADKAQLLAGEPAGRSVRELEVK